MEDTAASFHLNSSLLPGSLFECHLELVLETPDSGEDFLLFVIIFVINCEGSLRLGW